MKSTELGTLDNNEPLGTREAIHVPILLVSMLAMTALQYSIDGGKTWNPCGVMK